MGCGTSAHSANLFKEYHSEPSLSENMFQAKPRKPIQTDPPVIQKDSEDEKSDDTDRGSAQDLEKRNEKSLDEIKALLKFFEIADRTISPDCEYSDDLLRAVVSLDYYFSHVFGDDTPLDFLVKYRMEICNLLVGTSVFSLCFDLIIKSYQGNGKVCYSSSSMNACLCIILNFSDISEEISEIVANYPEFLETMKKILQDAHERHKPNNYTGESALDDYIATIHNLAMRDSCVARLRSLDFTSVLQPYLESPSEHLQLSALSALAGIVNEKESEIINANRHIVQVHLNILRKGLKNKHHRYEGWSCKELTQVVRMLARNDANKRLLVELGALEALLKLAQIGDEEEKTESTGAIWALCFDAENRTKVVSEEQLGIVDLLVELSKSEKKSIRKNCQGALWTLRDDLKTSCVERYRTQAGQERQKHRKKKSTGKIEEEKGGHIMISYQWSDQQTMKTITERLKAKNFKVWIDIEKMGGSTLEAMALAIEQAEVVLICISQKYKNSPNCRAEAEYAFQTNKPIVPLKMERGYIPDGWLGIIVGTRLFYEFSPKYPFEDKVNQLLQALLDIYRRNAKTGDKKMEPVKAQTVTAVSEGRDDVDSGVSRSTTATSVSMTTAAVTMATAEEVRKWGPADAKHWIEKSGLAGCNVDNLTGGEIALLMCMRFEAPEFFYKTLREMLNVNNLLTMSKIVWALKDLAVKQ